MTSNGKIAVQIDGEELQVEAGSTLMQAVSQTGRETPVICYHEATTPEGLCRLCVVEVEGWRTLPPACVTKVEEGMVIRTESERVLRSRRTILEMLNASVDLSQAPEIQAQMRDLEADEERFPQAAAREFPLLDDNPFYVRDYSKCLMCWRCVQACGVDMQLSFALSVGGRGHDSKIKTFFDNPMPETTCVFCGDCIAVCPTNALKDKTEHFLEQGLDYDAIRIEKKKARKRERNGD